MKIEINGEPRQVEGPLTLAALVEQMGLKSDRVAVELNREIAPRDRWSQTSLADGDRLEIVHFVGGGSGQTNLRLLGCLSIPDFIRVASLATDLDRPGAVSFW